MKHLKYIIIPVLLSLFTNLSPALSQTPRTSRSGLEMQLSAIEGVTEVFDWKALNLKKSTAYACARWSTMMTSYMGFLNNVFL